MCTVPWDVVEKKPMTPAKGICWLENYRLEEKAKLKNKHKIEIAKLKEKHEVKAKELQEQVQTLQFKLSCLATT